MSQDLRNMRVAVLATDGFEQAELTEPVNALRQNGAVVDIIAPQDGEIQGMQHHEKGDKFRVDRVLADTRPDEYAALVLPGGVANPDTLRIDKQAIAFIKHFVDAQKPIAAICHGPWTLIEAGAVRGKRITSWPSLQTDLRNAGADWVDEEVVVDQTLVTSRKPDDLPAFCAKLIEQLQSPQRAAA
ncbi:MAG: type 1 glutamine amidotransferase [Alphaproteobacteria bacterium]|nr:type 1 glutamine amidotransferase [Alphaproteobacteria bacterium]